MLYLSLSHTGSAVDLSWGQEDTVIREKIEYMCTFVLDQLGQVCVSWETQCLKLLESESPACTRHQAQLLGADSPRKDGHAKEWAASVSTVSNRKSKGPGMLCTWLVTRRHHKRHWGRKAVSRNNAMSAGWRNTTTLRCLESSISGLCGNGLPTSDAGLTRERSKLLSASAGVVAGHCVLASPPHSINHL